MSFSSERFDGCNFALSADLAVPEELRLPRNNEISQMLRYLLSLAGSRPQDEIQAMKGYFLEVIHLLSAMVYQFGGIAFRSALFTERNNAALDKNVPVTIERQSIQFPDVQDGEDLARSLGPLLHRAVKFCADLIGPQIVKDELAGLENQLSETVRRDLDKFALRAAHALA